MEKDKKWNQQMVGKNLEQKINDWQNDWQNWSLLKIWIKIMTGPKKTEKNYQGEK